MNGLTLEEMNELESQHPPLVGCRTAVFLQPHQRASRAQIHSDVSPVGDSGPTASDQNTANAERLLEREEIDELKKRVAILEKLIGLGAVKK